MSTVRSLSWWPRSGLGTQLLAPLYLVSLTSHCGIWFGCTYSLEDLLPSDVGQPRVQLLDLGHDIVDLALVLALNLACGADGHVH